jgi:hypothetical protein
VRVASHSSARVVVGHGACRPRSDGFNHILGFATWRWEPRDTELASGRVRTCSRRPLLETADVAVSEAEVDEGEELAGRRHPGLVNSPTLGQAVVVGLAWGLL